MIFLYKYKYKYKYNHFHFLKNFLAGGVFPEGRIGNVQLTGGNLTPLPDTKIVMVMMIMICLYDDDDDDDYDMFV